MSKVKVKLMILARVHFDQIHSALADLGRRAGRTPPPTGPNSFIFTYIFTKKCWHRGSTPPNGSTPPPYGKSWIRPLFRSIYLLSHPVGSLCSRVKTKKHFLRMNINENCYLQFDFNVDSTIPLLAAFKNTWYLEFPPGFLKSIYLLSC